MTSQDRHDLWQLYHRFYKSRAKAYGPRINKALKSQVDQFVKAYKAGLPDTKALEQVSSAELYTILKELYHDAGITYGAKTLMYIRRQKARQMIGFNELMTRLINAYFETELLNDVETITQTTRDLIRNILIESYAAGDSFDDIVEKMEDTGFTEARSRRIARTETGKASNTGAKLSAQSTGLKFLKTWISATDNRTRRMPRDEFDHLHMDGVTIQAAHLFIVPGKDGDESMEFPLDDKHGATAANIIDCRCTHGYIPIRENGQLVKV